MKNKLHSNEYNYIAYHYCKRRLNEEYRSTHQYSYLPRCVDLSPNYNNRYMCRLLSHRYLSTDHRPSTHQD